MHYKNTPRDASVSYKQPNRLFSADAVDLRFAYSDSENTGI